MSDTTSPLRHPNSVDGRKPHRFQPGNPGKPPGALSIVGKVRKICEEMGFHPVEEAIRRYRDPMTPHASKDYCLGLVADRLLPKMKAVEHINSTQELSKVLINIVAGQNPLQTVEHQDVPQDNVPNLEAADDQ